MASEPAKQKKPAVEKPAVKQRNNSAKTRQTARGRPFAKGESGNPKGRPPKGESLTDALKAAMGEDGKRRAAEKLLDLALGKGRRAAYFPALKYLFDRLEGEPIKAIAATVETAEAPVVLLREKQAEGEESNE